ncbi:hypothetical protein J2Y45_004699 [Dyadobacter sp. BE34]|uniref:Lipoprotein n=1 Tax=Dyadobacter fermentans TaxID=94254 RepID=A0ABU1R252_9BACT|nr:MULTISPECIES: DUF5034 domain-containing protein [Dyadobacter]MDR6807499.1 hypothetical protein [Dyadobacter fermentans]MDR7045240.1 hypothetical protein [Dyadobacter sp. BE242]MDR7199553.1 hypothetical protein [Dyadobacter sp. BE34]MDR7217988.1 hypothetical protein [Dyadobacter sp. BE31]MDR7265444.1 hypothetical protein [Dyadobacter sp. BE32]
MKKKISLIFLIAFTTQLIIACCDCHEPYKNEYKFEYLSAFNLDNSEANSVISESPIPRNAYGIKLQLGLRELSLDRNHFSLFSQANAMCCLCGADTTITPRDTITSLKITTINRFDDNHLKGSDVTELFKVLRHGNYVGIDSIIAHPDIYFKRTETEFIELYLFTPPREADEYSFKVDLAISNDTHLSAQTSAVNLK